MKLFRSSAESGRAAAAAPSKTKLSRRSSGMGELAKSLEAEDTLCALDLGYTSAANIRFLTERGHKIYSEDLLQASADPALATKDEQGNATVDEKKFLAENLVFPGTQFDVVLFWNLADYLDESLVKPVIGRLWSLMKPGGMLLAFFHTREAGPDAPCYRFHILGGDSLEMQPIEIRKDEILKDKDTRKGPASAGHNSSSGTLQLQRVFNNRHIENLFRDFASIKFFLARDNIREVLVVR